MEHRLEEYVMRVKRQAQVLWELEARLRVTESEVGQRGRLLGSIEETRERLRECAIEVP